MKLESTIALRRLVQADSGLVFNPRRRMHRQIKTAADRIAGHFNDIEGAIGRGTSIDDATAPDHIRTAIHRTVSSAMLLGFQDASRYSGKRMPKNYGKKISIEAAKRAEEVDGMMRATTQRWLRASNQFTLTPERALRAARFESVNAYYNGVWHALTGQGRQKHWVTTSGNPCDKCQDAEDAGYLDFDDIFPNGLDFPLAHLNCQCILLVR
jgi:hypothetical protein